MGGLAITEHSQHSQHSQKQTWIALTKFWGNFWFLKWRLKIRPCDRSVRINSITWANYHVIVGEWLTAIYNGIYWRFTRSVTTSVKEIRFLKTFYGAYNCRWLDLERCNLKFYIFSCLSHLSGFHAISNDKKPEFLSNGLVWLFANEKKIMIDQSY